MGDCSWHFHLQLVLVLVQLDTLGKHGRHILLDLLERFCVQFYQANRKVYAVLLLAAADNLCTLASEPNMALHLSAVRGELPKL